MTRKELFRLLHSAALEHYDEREATSVSYAVLDGLGVTDRVGLTLDPDAVVQPTDELYEALEKIRQGVPVQYVTGKCHFCGFEFAVSDSVLIPRPETEELVMWAVSGLPEGGKVLDVGTGSGAIAVSIARLRPDISVTGIDISGKALEVAARNALGNRVQISFEEVDILAGTEVVAAKMGKGVFDAIVSNPPYIPASEVRFMHRNVTEHEPHVALFVRDEDPLRFYDAIADCGHSLLKPGGTIYFEIFEGLAVEVLNLLEQKGYPEVELRQDINGKDRMVRAALK